MSIPPNYAYSITDLPAVFKEVWVQNAQGSYDKLTASGNDPVSVTWDDIEDKPATFAPEIGTTATTAKAGDYQPTWAQVTGKPSTFAPAAHAATLVNVAAGTDGLAAGNAQVTLQALATRIQALEDAAAV